MSTPIFFIVPPRVFLQSSTHAQASISVDNFILNGANKGRGGGFTNYEQHRQPGTVRMRDRKPRYDCDVSEGTRHQVQGGFELRDNECRIPVAVYVRGSYVVAATQFRLALDD